MSQTMHEVCLLLGSNIAPEKYLPLSMALLQKQANLIQASSVWESPAIGSDGPNMLNAAVLALTRLNAGDLKEHLIRPIEAQLGRVRTADKNAPRTIDIDAILFDQKLLDPDLWRYAHRAVPVGELLPGFLSETGEYLKDAASRLARSASIRVRSDVLLLPFQSHEAGRVSKPAVYSPRPAVNTEMRGE